MDNGPGTEGRMIGDWLDNPSVMMYLDPSYISPTSEQEALEGIDWRGVNCLSDAIKENIEGEENQLTLEKSTPVPSTMRNRKTFFV